MKKPTRHDHLSETSRRSAKGCQQTEGRWEFTASQSLFTLGATEQARRVAYRNAAGEVRFLPL